MINEEKKAKCLPLDLAEKKDKFGKKPHLVKGATIGGKLGSTTTDTTPKSGAPAKSSSLKKSADSTPKSGAPEKSSSLPKSPPVPKSGVPEKSTYLKKQTAVLLPKKDDMKAPGKAHKPF